jgi:hypothetical protein
MFMKFTCFRKFQRNLFSKHILKFADKFKNTTNYTYHIIQEQIISLCAISVRNKIIHKIGDS